MLDEKKLDDITRQVVDVMRNPDMTYSVGSEEERDEILYIMRSHIASLHNLLYEMVTGDRYDYMFHWCNKVGSDVSDNIYDEDFKWEVK